MNRTLPGMYERAQATTDDTGEYKQLKEQLARLEAKLGLTFSYETKIRALEQRLDELQNSDGANSDFDRELQKSGSNSTHNEVFKQSLQRTESNLIGSFDKLQENLQASLQLLNKQLSGMEDGFLEMFKQNETEHTRLSKHHNQSIKRLEVLEQSVSQLGKTDRSSAISAFESLVQLKIDSMLLFEVGSINETSTKLNSIESELHRSETRLRQEMKAIIEQQSHFKETHEASKDRENFDRMLEDMNEKINGLTNKVANQEKAVTASRQLLDSTRGQLIKSTHYSEQSNDQLKRELEAIKEALKKEIDGLRGQLTNKPAHAMSVPEQTYSANQRTSLDSFEKPDSAGGNRNQLFQPNTKNPLPPPKKVLGSLTTQDKGQMLIADEMTPPHSVSRFNEPVKEEYTIGIKGLRKSKEKDPPQTTAAFPNNKELKPLSSMFNPPKPRRNLPPVQADQKLVNKHQMSRVPPQQRYLHSSEEEEEEQFFVNEEGYIINQQGQLILDKWGQPILFPTDEDEEDY